MDVSELIAVSMKIGIISDTHGLLRPQAVEILQGCDAILHAGDVGSSVLQPLSELAPLYAIRGNVDREGPPSLLPAQLNVAFFRRRFLLIHDSKELQPTDLINVDVVICGHSHKARVDNELGILRINPGSAGPRRFKLPVGLGVLRLDKSGFMDVELMENRL